MANETITMEWIATATKMNQVIDRLNAKFDKQEKALQKLANTSKKAAAEAATGFNKLEKEFKENVAALKKLEMGTKAFAAQKRKVDELRIALQKAKGAMVGTASATSGAMRTGIGHMASLAAGMVGFQAVVAAVVSDLEKAQNIKLAAAATERTLEQTLADMGQNIGGENIPEARRIIEEKAPELKTTQAGLGNLMGIAISAGAKDLVQAYAVSAAALKVTAGEAEKANGLLGGALDVASLGGSQNFEGAIGQLLQSASQLRGTNLSTFSENVGSGLAAATADRQNQAGLSTEEALETAAVISQILKDQTGAVTATTLTQFVGRMDAFAPELAKTLKDSSTATVPRELIDTFKQTKSVEGRVALMRENEGLARQFIDQQKEGKGKTAISEIVQGTDRVLGFEARAKEAVTPIDEANVKFDTLVKGIDSATPAIQAERQATGNIEQFRTGGILGLEGEAVKVLRDTIAEIDLPGSDFLQTKALEAELKLSDDKTGTAIDLLNVLLSGEAGGFGKRTLSDEEKQLIRLQLEVLQELRDDRQRQLAVPVAAQANGQAPVRPQAAPLPALVAP
jgi:hypothetical protein